MSEIFFILTVIYVAYVLFQSSGDQEQNVSTKMGDLNTFKPSAKPAIKVEASSPTKKPAPVPTKKTQPEKTEGNKQTAPKIELRTVVMKNPATGEQAKVAGNYRMTKRWIKEALVEEGLLDKIYKNNELDDAAKVVVKKALSIIKAMDKYKP